MHFFPKNGKRSNTQIIHLTFTLAPYFNRASMTVWNIKNLMLHCWKYLLCKNYISFVYKYLSFLKGVFLDNGGLVPKGFLVDFLEVCKPLYRGVYFPIYFPPPGIFFINGGENEKWKTLTRSQETEPLSSFCLSTFPFQDFFPQFLHLILEKIRRFAQIVH